MHIGRCLCSANRIRRIYATVLQVRIYHVYLLNLSIIVKSCQNCKRNGKESDSVQVNKDESFYFLSGWLVGWLFRV